MRCFNIYLLYIHITFIFGFIENSAKWNMPFTISFWLNFSLFFSSFSYVCTFYFIVTKIIKISRQRKESAYSFMNIIHRTKFLRWLINIHLLLCMSWVSQWPCFCASNKMEKKNIYSFLVLSSWIVHRIHGNEFSLNDFMFIWFNCTSSMPFLWARLQESIWKKRRKTCARNEYNILVIFLRSVLKYANAKYSWNMI